MTTLAGIVEQYLSAFRELFVDRERVWRGRKRPDISQHIAKMAVDLPGLGAVGHRKYVAEHQEPAEVATAETVVEHGIFFPEEPPCRNIGGYYRPRQLEQRGVAPCQRERIAVCYQYSCQPVGRVYASYFCFHQRVYCVHGFEQRFDSLVLGGRGQLPLPEQRKLAGALDHIRKIERGVAEADIKPPFENLGVALEARRNYDVDAVVVGNDIISVIHICIFSITAQVVFAFPVGEDEKVVREPTLQEITRGKILIPEVSISGALPGRWYKNGLVARRIAYIECNEGYQDDETA